MLDARGDDEELAGPKDDRIAPFHLDPEAAVPAEEHLVLLVVMPGKLAVESGDPYDRVVDRYQVLRLPGRVDGSDDVADRDRCRRFVRHAFHAARPGRHRPGRDDRRAAVDL